MRIITTEENTQGLEVEGSEAAMRDEGFDAIHSSYEDVELDVASILLEMSDGLPGKEDGVARERQLVFDGSSSFPSSGEIINEKRKLIVIRPKRRQSTPFAGFALRIVNFLSAVRVALTTPGAEDLNLALTKPPEAENSGKRPGHGLFMGINKRNAEGNFVFHSSEKDTTSSICSDCTQLRKLPSLTFDQIMQRVRSNPGDARVLEIKVRLQDLLRGVLRIFLSTTPPPGITWWKPLVVHAKRAKLWSWVGPVPSQWPQADVIPTSPEAWGMRRAILNWLVDCFEEWLKATLDVLQQIPSLPPPPLSLMPLILPQERFTETRNLKNSVLTIGSSCEAVRAYFQREEVLRYSIPERAFTYTTRDGMKSAVAPLKRCSGKPSKKTRDHYILKPDRPPSFTVLCLVRDAAARLPHRLGTRSDICTLVRDSQFVKEDATDSEVKQVVIGTLDRLHYERDPCIIFDRDERLWSYLHGNKEEEDFDENCTVSAKRRNNSKKLRAKKDGKLESSKS